LALARASGEAPSLLWERKVKVKGEDKTEKPFPRRGKFATHLKSIPSMLRAQSANKNLPAIDTEKSDIPKLPPLEASALMTKTNVSAISQGVLDALADDPDAEKSLADIRRILAGPTRRLQDARFDEFVSILEEMDRKLQNSVEVMSGRCNELSAISDKLFAATDETRQRMDHQTERLNAEVRRNTEARQEIASELRLFFESRIEKLEADMKQRIEALDRKIAQEGQTLLSDLSTRMYEFSESAKSNLDGILSVFETRLEKVEWQTANDQRRQIEVFAGGLSEIAGQLQGIKKVKGKGK
jgi:hypothetical protein